MTEIKRRSIESMVKGVSDTILEPNQVTRVEFINSGCTVLNMCISGRGRDGGWARGRVVNIIGDGSTGKTILALEAAAYAFYRLNKNPETFSKVKKIIIVYNNVEGVMDFPLEKMYKEEFVNAVEWVQIKTIQGMGRDYTHRVMNLKEGEFLLYITDSFDALVSEESQERFIEAAKKDESEDDSYNMEKQKYASKLFAELCGFTEGKDATLVIISQVRANIGVSFGKKYRRVGGKALDFYTHQCVWLAVKKKLEKTVKGDTRAYGIVVRAQLERNKVAKPYREVDFVVLFDYGVDNILSNLLYVYGEKAILSKEEKTITFEGKKFPDTDKLISHIRENHLEATLDKMVIDKWNYVEEAIKPKRDEKF